MNADQKKVAVGALSGALSMALLVWFFFSILPSPALKDDVLSRIIFTLQMNVIGALPLFVGIAIVGNGRFLSNAIDPLRHAENKKLEINGRFVDNTLQQNFIFLVGTLALSTFLMGETIKLISALTIVYVIARIVFWIGYRIDPLYRAPGMAATSYMNLGILLYTLHFLFF